MGTIIGNPIIVISGFITDTAFNFADRTPITILTIDRPIYPVLFGLYFYDVTTDFISTNITSTLQLMETVNGNVYMTNRLDADAVFTNNSFINLVTWSFYRPTVNFPFVSPCDLNLYYVNPLQQQGVGSIRYTFGYTYL